MDGRMDSTRSIDDEPSPCLLDTSTLLGSSVGLSVGMAISAVGTVGSLEVLELGMRVGLDGLGAFNPVRRANFTVGVLFISS